MRIIHLCIIFMVVSGNLLHVIYAQDRLPVTPTLDELLDYALRNRISIKMAEIGEEIGEKEIAASLAGYYPQLHAGSTLDRFLQLPAFVIDGEVIQTGQRNTAIAGAQARQAILSPELIRASRAAKFVRKGYQQQSESEKIDAVVDVSKAYFDILTTEEEIRIIRENIIRIQRQFDETHARYEVGLVDHTDHDRAQVSLNNVLAELKRATELRKYKYDYLKQLLGLPFSTAMDLSFHKENLDGSILLDNHDLLNETKRIEYRQLQNTLDLQVLQTRFQRWQFLPVIGAHADYQLNFFSDRFRNLFNGPIPNSNIGLSLSIPVFVGFRRRHEIRKSALTELQLDWELKDLKYRISAEYSAAIASYAANMAEWKSNKDNVKLSESVYNTIRLQYNQGLKTYLDLMVAETELRASQINYLNALYAVLASKVDLQKAKGDIKIN